MKHYVYKLIDPRNDETFYIGKGTGDRMKHHVRNVKNEKQNYKKKNPHRYNKIRSILESGYEDVEYEKPYEYEESKKAFDKEEKLINEYGLENLVNICPGGFGGYNPEAAEANSKIRSGSTWEKIYGKEQAEQKRQKMSAQFEGEGNPFYNKTHTEENKLKFSKQAKKMFEGKSLSEEHKQKISKSNEGTNTLEWYIEKYGEKEGRQKYNERIEKISKKQAENWQDPEYREKQCKKLSKAQKKRWERKGKKLTKEQVEEALENSNTVAAARRYARDNYEEVSRPTFDKYIKEYGLESIKEKVVSSSGY